jgi:hypothetical protein
MYEPPSAVRAWGVVLGLIVLVLLFRVLAHVAWILELQQ